MILSRLLRIITLVLSFALPTETGNFLHVSGACFYRLLSRSFLCLIINTEALVGITRKGLLLGGARLEFGINTDYKARKSKGDESGFRNYFQKILPN